MTTYSLKTREAAGSDTFLLKEDGGYLLLETGDKIVLSYGSGRINKARVATSYTKKSRE